MAAGENRNAEKQRRYRERQKVSAQAQALAVVRSGALECPVFDVGQKGTILEMVNVLVYVARAAARDPEQWGIAVKAAKAAVDCFHKEQELQDARDRAAIERPKDDLTRYTLEELQALREQVSQ